MLYNINKTMLNTIESSGTKIVVGDSRLEGAEYARDKVGRDGLEVGEVDCVVSRGDKAGIDCAAGLWIGRFGKGSRLPKLLQDLDLSNDL